MSATQPIRDKELLRNFKNYYLYVEPHYRNYALIITGLNTALRINDLLHLTWDMLYNSDQVKKHLTLKEHKTGKYSRLLINSELQTLLKEYHRRYFSDSANPYLFCSSRKVNEPLSRYQAYRIIRHAAKQVGLTDHISCHSLRKTFGYQAWKQGTPPALLMSIYNHSSYQITRRYLCIEQDDKDAVFSNINL